MNQFRAEISADCARFLPIVRRVPPICPPIYEHFHVFHAQVSWFITNLCYFLLVFGQLGRKLFAPVMYKLLCLESCSPVSFSSVQLCHFGHGTRLHQPLISAFCVSTQVQTLCLRPQSTVTHSWQSCLSEHFQPELKQSTESNSECGILRLHQPKPLLTVLNEANSTPM